MIQEEGDVFSFMHIQLQERVSFLFPLKNPQIEHIVCNKVSEDMIPYCFWISLGLPAGRVWAVNEEETIGLKNYRDIIHLGMLKYQRMDQNRTVTLPIYSDQAHQRTIPIYFCTGHTE